MMSPLHAQNTVQDIPELLHPQRMVEHGDWLSHEHLIIFKISGGAILTPAGTLTGISVFSSPEPKAHR